jgi:hypothetical protein
MALINDDNHRDLQRIGKILENDELVSKCVEHELGKRDISVSNWNGKIETKEEFGCEIGRKLDSVASHFYEIDTSELRGLNTETLQPSVDFLRTYLVISHTMGGRSEEFILLSKGLARTAGIESKGFNFAVGSQEFGCSVFQAAFISGILHSDNTFNRFEVSKYESNAEIFELVNCLMKGNGIDQ